MKVLNFDITKGIYHFEISDLNTEFHSHPVIEIVRAIEGEFCLETESDIYKNLTFSIIDPNLKHRISSDNVVVEVLMVESHNDILDNFLKKHSFNLVNGIYNESLSTKTIGFISTIIKMANSIDLQTTSDVRVEECLDILNKEHLEYNEMMAVLESRISLSGGRISHLFKEAIGISLKKYLVWTKMKQAMNSFLNGANLTQVAHQHGFFDQAHLSNAFLKHLGVRPSKEYNSRTLQL